ncbi:MAG: hypothetical protein ACLPRE_08385 [Limisphaerales bacterium]
MENPVYRKLTTAEKARHVLGQIFWIPAYLHMQDYYVVRVGQWDRLAPITSAQFRLEKKSFHGLGHNADLYHHMPIPELKLKMDEELVVKKVKRRPAVLILRDGTDPRRTATHFSGLGPKPNPNSHVFAPIVSLKKEDNLGNDYPPAFIEKVNAGELPEFIHLPAEGVIIKNESMAVLTQLQSHAENAVEETDLALDAVYLGAALETFWQDLEAQLLS